MRSSKHLSDDELRRELSKPYSKREVERIRKARLKRRCLLALKLRDMNREENETDDGKGTHDV